MRIAHICLASYFTENMTYQDNQLTNQNVLDGHDVQIGKTEQQDIGI